MFLPLSDYNTIKSLLDSLKVSYNSLPKSEGGIMMNRVYMAMEEVGLAAKLADLKEEHYRNTLALSTIIELLIEKNILTREEVEKKAADLDSFMENSPYPTV